MSRLSLWIAFLLLPFGVESLSGAPVRDQRVAAELVSTTQSIQPGTPLLLGLRLLHDPKWHTYWKASTTGYATSLTWDLPEGFEGGELRWPVPRTYEMGGIVESVYEGEVILPVLVTPSADLVPGTTVTLRARAEWLMCADVCIPGEVDLSLTLPVTAETPAPDPTHAAAFAAARDALPVPLEEAGVELAAWRSGQTVHLAVHSPDGPLPGDLYFFDARNFLQAVPSQTVEEAGGRSAVLRLPIDPAGLGVPERLEGVLATRAGSWLEGAERPGLALDLAWSEAPPAFLDAATSVENGPGAPRGLLALLGLAFLGGLVLNLMPCVFPVIGLKIMGFVNQAGEARGKVVLHGLTFTAGVLVSFWALAGLLLLLRSGGSQLGWGFQLQDPVFVFLLTLFLFAFALNLSGIFEIGTSTMNVGNSLSRKSGFTGSFFSGVLATVVATPCAAPFLAPALGAALALPPLSSLIVFTAIALGLSLPYLLLSAFPGMTRLLPRPGAWMETLKQFMAFLLYGTAGVLLWVLVGQLVEEQGFTPFALLNVIFAIVIVALAAWVYGRWGAPHRKSGTRVRAYLATAALAIGAVVLGYPTPIVDVEWEKWEPGKAEQLAAEGRLVYVDFTARWCLTCQTNKAAVFQSEAVKQFFADNGVVALKADWTNRDADITAALASFERSAVPFNLIYGPGLDRPLELPELLTPGTVLDHLERAGEG
jgi:thiol:disulfide interchange protein/DsbC/DsbD-like thiol-disulfide interchange protein